MSNNRSAVWELNSATGYYEVTGYRELTSAQLERREKARRGELTYISEEEMGRRLRAEGVPWDDEEESGK